MRAGDLLPHPLNPRTHPVRQHAAVQAFLRRIGIADRLLGRFLPDGRVQLLHGHLRREDLPDTVWPVLITDLNDAEAEEFLLMLHTLAELAEDDPEHLQQILDTVRFDEAELQAVLDEITRGAQTLDDWNEAHDYGLGTAHDRTYMKLVIAIHHHHVIEQALQAAAAAFACDRGEALTRICELAAPHLP